METIKLILPELVVEGLHYTKAVNQSDINNFVSEILAEYILTIESIGFAPIVPVKSKKKAEIEIKIPKVHAMALQKVVKGLSHCNKKVIDNSDVINSALALKIPILAKAVEIEDEFAKERNSMRANLKPNELI